MKRKLLSLVITTVLLLASPVIAQETSVSPDDATISERCKITQSYLNDKLKERDIRNRVDRLQAYNYIYQRFDTMTIRLEKNHQPGAQPMRSEMEKLHAAIGSFKSAYEVYDVGRDQLANLAKCAERPAEFRAQLEDVRRKRQSLADSVVSVQTILRPDLETQLNNLSTVLQTTKKSGN